MLFVGNPSGISHAPAEALDRLGLRRVARVMLAAIPQIARGGPQ
jgi:hypothetical protein